MSSITTEKLCLGTATFGLVYGIASKTCKVAKNEVFRILDYCHSIGLNALDTAFSYGESEKVIGDYIRNNNCNFRIMSKLPALEKFDSQEIENTFYESLRRLRLKSIYGYLIHRFDDFSKYEELWEVLQRLKDRQLVEKIGFSLYRPQELEFIFSRDISFDILQVPYSVFDMRFSDFFKALKEKNVEINVRSVFLQGLMFLDPRTLTGKLIKASPHIETLQNLAKKKDISLNALCLNFVLLNPLIDKAVLGVERLEHLKKNVEGLRLAGKVKDIHDELAGLSIRDEDIILPYKWELP